MTPPQAHNRANSRQPVLRKRRLGKASARGPGQTVALRGRTSAGLRCGLGQTAGASMAGGQRRGRADGWYCSRRSGGLFGPNGRAAGRRARQRGRRAPRAKDGLNQTRGEPKEPQSTLESPKGSGKSRAE